MQEKYLMRFIVCKKKTPRHSLATLKEYLRVVVPVSLLEIMLLIKTGFPMKYALNIKCYLLISVPLLQFFLDNMLIPHFQNTGR